MNNLFTIYQTNEPNILGGYMTYNTLGDAMKHLCPSKGINTIVAVTKINAEWWHGKKMPYLYETLSSGIIYRA